MIDMLKALRDGRDLRHLPVVWPGPGLVRIMLEDDTDVTHDHTPVSLKPLLIGLSAYTANRERASMRFVDASTGIAIGALTLERVGAATGLGIYRPVAVRNSTMSGPYRAWRHWLARRRAARATHDRVGMTGDDLVALNVYYSAPRPVYLIGVSHEGRRNLFPMDLVSTIGGVERLALRSTSAAISMIIAAGRLTMSTAPAKARDAIYALGKHSREEPSSLEHVPLSLKYIGDEQVPALATDSLVREIRIAGNELHGSHMLFTGTCLHEQGTRGNQLAHMSGTYADWLEQRHRGVTRLSAQ